MSFDLEYEVPILTSKQVFAGYAVKELYWIYILQSNDVRDLHQMGVTIWDEWMGEDFTIGRAYGYQIRKFKQLDRLIDGLKRNPYDRGHIISLWNIEDLPFMNLRPCAYETIWDVTDGYLNCSLIQRSGDWGLGVPFNTYQYAILTYLMAQVTGLRAGTLTHFINNAHIYDRHYEKIAEQITRERHEAPELWINPDIHNIYDFKPEDVRLIDYKHSGRLDMEVAI
jgi:thymidylate synthase